MIWSNNPWKMSKKNQRTQRWSNPVLLSVSSSSSSSSSLHHFWIYREREIHEEKELSLLFFSQLNPSLKIYVGFTFPGSPRIRHLRTKICIFFPFYDRLRHRHRPLLRRRRRLRLLDDGGGTAECSRRCHGLGGHRCGRRSLLLCQ